jgi:photosystem II stability/assembly factor-like uncharacterized protein
MNNRLVLFVLLLAMIAGSFDAKISFSQEQPDADKQLFEALKFRSIGPFRGGRSAAVTGVRGEPMLYYMGGCGGGVWKTEDAGATWQNISDGFFGGSIGAVAVAPSDPNIIYVGGGEVTVRGNVSHGYGMWKSYDAGKTWKQIGLDDSRHIPRIRIHPKDPSTVYVAALGHLFGPNQERGVFKSTDGGETWNKVLFASEDAGAVDLVIDPNNPRVLYASTWNVRRTPYSLESGGEGSGIWKSTDEGATWKEITRNPGLPTGTVGIIGIAVSPVDSNRIWAQVEAEDGGLFRSDDAGKTWTRVNDERNLRQRAWYYTRVYAGTKNIDEVYVLNVGFWRSGDGGKTFSSISTPHGDHHDLWIDPDDPERMIIGDDGGAQVSHDRGQNWSDYDNQPTAQFYRVTTDNHFPYRIYGAQQDNSTVRIAHRSSGYSIGERDWEPTAGGESGFIAPDPTNPEIVYGGSYGGDLIRLDHRTDQSRAVNVWPDNPMGHGAIDTKYRFQWNFPIFFSVHDSKTLYAAGNVLFKTSDEGSSWEPISPDLTRNDPSKLGSSGGPITQDNTSVEYYCTIFAATESLAEKDVIWVGSDDGLIHVTRDGGKNWENVTPPTLPEWSQINSLEPHPSEPGGLYVAATRYKLDDFRPYLYKTLDYGKTWTQITDGIDRKHFTRVIRADAKRSGLLFAGTESGLYVSLDDGKSWKSFQCNLPQVPITDLALKDNDLIVATQGRSFWVLDDLSLLQQWQPDVLKQPMTMFENRPVYRMGGGGGRRPNLRAGQNVRGGVTLNFYLKEKPDEKATVKLEIFDAANNPVKTFSSKPDKELEEDQLKLEQGLNEVTWEMRYKGAETFDNLILWGGGTQGPLAVPGTFKAVLTNGDQSREVNFEIVRDPRSTASPEDLQAQFDFLIGVRDKLTETHKTIKKLRDVRNQLNSWQARLKKAESKSGPQSDAKPVEGGKATSSPETGAGEDTSLAAKCKKLADELTEIEIKLYQTKNQSSQDPLNFPIRLNNRLSALVGVVSEGDNAPTKQSYEVRDALVAEIDQHLQTLQELLGPRLEEVNQAFRDARIPAIFVE